MRDERTLDAAFVNLGRLLIASIAGRRRGAEVVRPTWRLPAMIG
jgi:hypothetical protein